MPSNENNYEHDEERDKRKIFSRLTELCGHQLTEEQELRVGRLIKTFNMTHLFEVEYMTVMWEYYLSQNKELLERHVRRLEELLNTECTDAIANKLETSLSARLTEAVIAQSEERVKESIYAESILKHGFFLLTFAVFGVLFFISGILAHGKGLPAWIAHTTIGSQSLTEALIGLFLGVPVGWILWLGGGAASAYYLYEYVKANPSSGIEEFFVRNKWKLLFFATSLLIILGIIAWL